MRGKANVVLSARTGVAFEAGDTKHRTAVERLTGGFFFSGAEFVCRYPFFVNKREKPPPVVSVSSRSG